MNGIFVRWLTLTVAIMVAAYLMEGITVAGFFSAFLAAAILVAGAAEPQLRTVSIDGETVRQIRDGESWFTAIEAEITVRFDDETRTLARFREAVSGMSDDLRALADLEVVRVNRLGIYDLRVPAGADAFDLARRFGAEVAARLADVVFPWLDAPIRRVGHADRPSPYAEVLEAELLPTRAKVLAAARELLEF